MSLEGATPWQEAAIDEPSSTAAHELMAPIEDAIQLSVGCRAAILLPLSFSVFLLTCAGLSDLRSTPGDFKGTGRG